MKQNLNDAPRQPVVTDDVTALSFRKSLNSIVL